MLRFEVLTLFPDIFTSFLEESLIKRAIEKQYLNVSLVNFRKHGHGKHLQVDDTPYGRSEEHTSELQSRTNLVCRLLLEKKKN